MKADRSAWQPGASWLATNEKGYHLKAIIVSPSRPNHKIVWMDYQDGPHMDRPVQQEYSHRHMKKHFIYTGKSEPIPPTPEKDKSFRELLDSLGKT